MRFFERGIAPAQRVIFGVGNRRRVLGVIAAVVLGDFGAKTSVFLFGLGKGQRSGGGRARHGKFISQQLTLRKRRRAKPHQSSFFERPWSLLASGCPPALFAFRKNPLPLRSWIGTMSAFFWPWRAPASSSPRPRGCGSTTRLSAGASPPSRQALARASSTGAPPAPSSPPPARLFFRRR